MQNDRPIEDTSLRQALDEVHEVLERHGLAGAVMLVSPVEAAFFYQLAAEWSAFRVDLTLPLGFKLYANSKRDGQEITSARVGAAVHTICQLADFGNQTMNWMEQLKAMMCRSGVEFEHTSFNGKPLPQLTTVKP